METSNLQDEFIQRGYAKLGEGLDVGEVGDLVDAIELLKDVRLTQALTYLEEKFPPEKLKVAIMSGLTERIAAIDRKREELFAKYADEKRNGKLVNIDDRLSFFRRIEENIRSEISAGIKPKVLASYIGFDDMEQIKKIGFVKWLKSPFVLLESYHRNI